MILYGSAELLAGVQPNKPDISLPAGTRGLIVTNLSTWTLYVRIAPSGVELTIPPICVGQLNVENASPGNATMSVSSDSSITAQFSGSPSIRYTTSVAPIPTNIIPLAPIPAYTQNTNITNANINATVTGAVDANITNANINANVTGAVDANITNASIDVSGSSVAISNPTSSPVPVSQQGTVDVAVTGTADVSGSSVIVNNPTGSPIPVTQTSTINANITNASLAISSVGSITDNINSAIVNEKLGANSLIYLGSATLTVSNLANGASIGSAITPTSASDTLGIYDGVVLFITRSGSHTPSDIYSVSNNGLTVAHDSVLTTFGYVFASGDPFPSFPAIYSNGSANSGTVGPVMLSVATAFNGVEFFITNISGSTITSDTVIVYAFAIKAQISNPAQNPVQSQVGQGAFDSLYNIDVVNQSETAVPGTSTFTYTLIDSSQGGYVKTINISQLSGSGLSSPSTTEIRLLVNGSVVYDSGAGSGTGPILTNADYSFGNGVAVGSGVVLEVIYNNQTANNITVTNTAVATAIGTQTAAPSKAVILT